MHAIRGWEREDYQRAPNLSEISGSRRQRGLDLAASLVFLDRLHTVDALLHTLYVDSPIFALDAPFVLLRLYRKSLTESISVSLCC